MRPPKSAQLCPTAPGVGQTVTTPRNLPVGPGVVYVSVSIDASSPNALRIVQSSDRAIVNWQSFDIAAGNSVDVRQPGAQATALFRVTGDFDSRIAGSLTANGKLFLINPNGIAIGAGATINTGSFVASTLDIADADFLSGNLTFRRTGAARGIYNGGTITANGGDVALLGSSVVNEGLVSAKLGRIAYGAGDAITLDFGGDKFLSIAIPVRDAAGLTDVFGRELSALVTAAGRTEAQGGQIYLSARAARDLMLGAVRIDGDLVATSFREGEHGQIRLGSIEVDGGDAMVQALGRIDASGGAGLTGGSVDISGRAVALGGEITASGERGGGTITVAAQSALSIAGTMSATGPRGDGGAIHYSSGGSIVENAGSTSNVSGGLNGGTIRVMGAGDVATSGGYAADGLLGFGGQVDITGGSIRLLSTQISARGMKQGGLVRIGGAFQGGAADRTARTDFDRFEGRFATQFGPLAPLTNAQTTFVNDGVVINLTSSRGIGGGAIIWSDQQTTMLGTIDATGIRGGGTAEVSGKDELRYIDLSAVNTGPGGQLLLDPQNIVIGDFAQASGWQYAAVIGAGVGGTVPGIGDLDANDGFGTSVALNAAGDRMAVGSPGDDGFGAGFTDSGAVRVFTFTDTRFGGAKLAGIIGRGYLGAGNLSVAVEAGDHFGQSVALNASGNSLAVGAPEDDGQFNGYQNTGAVHLIGFTDTSFTNALLVGTIGRGYTSYGSLDVGATVADNEQFGYSVALNAAGNRLAVGQRYDTGFGGGFTQGGAVRLFSFATNYFNNPSLVGTIGVGYTGAGDLDITTTLTFGDAFGTSVALNAAGDRLAVGAPLDDGTSAPTSADYGAVHLFRFADTSFGGRTLAATVGYGYSGVPNLHLIGNLFASDGFGTSVALNGVGDRLAVGSPGANAFPANVPDTGSVRLFTFGSSDFGGGTLAATIGRTSFSADTVPSGYFDLGSELNAFDQFGSSVALNAAGNLLAVGAAADDGALDVSTNSGSVRLFAFGDTSFSGGFLVGTIGRGYASGYTVDLGTGLEASDRFGWSLALNQTGDRLAVGSAGDGGFSNVLSAAGAVRLFTFADSNFRRATLTGIVGSGYVGTGNVNVALDSNDNFGASVAISANGNALAVGAPGDDGAYNNLSNSGAVRLFTFVNAGFGGGAFVGTIGRGYVGTGNIDLGSALDTFDSFGRSVALNAAGNRLAVGASNDGGSGNVVAASGSVRLFTFADNSFNGGSLAATIGVGYTGGNNINLSTSLGSSDFFGTSVALNGAGDRLAVGATGDDGATNAVTNVGAVRLFSFTDTSFAGGTLVGTIGRGYSGAGDLDVGSGLEAVDVFGISVALNAAGDRLAVGATQDDGAYNSAPNVGAVYLFGFTNGDFGGISQAAVIGRGYANAINTTIAASLDNNDTLGASVAFNAAGDRLAIGATGDDGLGTSTNSGAIWLFDVSGTDLASLSLLGRVGLGYTGANNFDTTNAQFGTIGSSVALSGDGNSVVLGVPNIFGSVIALRRYNSAGTAGNLLFADNATGTSNMSVAALQTALSAGQSISLEASNDITLQSNLVVNNASGAGGALNLRAGRSILLNGSITTDDGNLSLIANSGGNDLTTVNANRLAGAAAITMAAGTSINAGTGTVSINLTNGAGLTTPTSGSITLGSITAGAIQVTNAGPTAGSDIVLASGAVLTASGTGRAIDIRAATGTFTNNAGTGALVLTGGGTYGVFSDAPTTTTEGVLGYLKRYNVGNEAAFAALNPGGSFFAYRIAPVLTVTADNASRVYGNANPAFTYGISGFIDGDTAAGSLTGAASLTTLADGTSGIGSYAITSALGTLVSAEGYQFNFVDGALTVTARPITITADALSRIYGNANPALTYSVGGDGLVNGDTLTGALATTAGLSSNVGSYAITQGSLAASSNYALTYNGANLTVTARPITVTADALSRIYGNANPSLTYSVGGDGLVNGDALTGSLATTAGLASNVGAYAISRGTLAASGNYTIAYTGANLVITPRPILVVADDLAKIFGAVDPVLTYRVGGLGLVNGDRLSGALGRDAGEATGRYAIRLGTLGNANYSIQFTPGTLTIDPASAGAELSPSIATETLSDPLATPPVGSPQRDPATPKVDPVITNAASAVCSISAGGVCLQPGN